MLKNLYIDYPQRTNYASGYSYRIFMNYDDG